MAGGYDGSIRIDTSINSQGFNKGISAMVGGLKSLAVAVGVAFGVGAVVAFGKTAVNAASELQSAWIGLKSVLDGTGKSFEAGKAFIQSYIKDGLVPATNAINAYKNLAIRGYDTGQIEKTLTALKDSASFARQGSLSMGQAIQGATEGLKNENSILVDNAGVTKNVSMMWKDYAAKIGTTVGALTKQQKIQAEVEGIMEETRFQTGDAARLSGTYAGQVAALGTSFYNLKVAVGNSIIPIISSILPYIKAAIDNLVIFFNRVAQIMSLLFGVQVGGAVDAMESMADGTNAAADAQANLASETEKAGKAAEGALAGFDELNVLQMADGEVGATPGATPGGGVALPMTPEETDSATDKLKEKVEKFKTYLKGLLEPSLPALEHLGAAFAGLGARIMEGLGWVWENILVPFGEWVAKEVAPRFFEILADVIDILNVAIDEAKPLLQWLWDYILKPIAEWTGQAFLDFLDWWAEGLDRVKVAIQDGGLKEGYRAAFQYILDTGKRLLGELWDWIVNLFGKYKDWFAENVAVPVGTTFLVMWINIKTWAVNAWNDIKNIWNSAGSWFSNIGYQIMTAFNTALNWVSDKWKEVFGGIKNFVNDRINDIISMINAMIRAIAGGINAVVDGINAIKISIPANPLLPQGFSWSTNLARVSAPQIPMLATGAVIPANAPFAAILGDQRSGTNIEAPLDTITQAVMTALDNRQIGGDMTITMPVYLDSEKIYEGQKRVSARRGPSLLDGATA